MNGNLKNIFRFNKIFWWVVCVLLVANIIFFLMVRDGQKTRLNELENRYNIQRRTETPKTDETQERFLKAGNDIELFKERLPEKKDFADIAAELFAILKKHQIDVGQTVYKPETVDIKGLFKYSTNLNIKGSYPVLKAVLADIQESRTLFSIENLSLSGGAGDNSIEMKIKIAAYFR